MKGKMVKLTGPALSLGASKSFGKLMTFQKRPSGHAVYFKRKPGDLSPLFPTAPQFTQRAGIAEAVAAWQALTAAEKASWEVSAKAANYQGTGYHFFMHSYQYGAPAPPPPPVTLIIRPALIDNFMFSANPWTNFGTSVNLAWGSDAGAVQVYRSLIKFDLTDLPVDATIITCTLSLYLNTNAGGGYTTRTVSVYRVKRVWTEAGSCWNSYSTGNSWQIAGAAGADDIDTSPIGAAIVSVTQPLGYFNIPLTPTTKADLDLGNGFMFRVDTENQDAYYINSDQAADANTKPMLTIVYTV